MQVLTIGRDTANHIVLDGNFVSRQHAQLILMDNGQVLLKDLGSANGTFVNGNRITEYYLKPGDVVKCASVFLDWQSIINSSKQLAYNSNPRKEEPLSQYSSHNAVNSENKLFISSSISDDLPAMVRNELATLSAQKQQEFVEEYNRKKKSVVTAYLLMCPLFFMGMHYAYLRKWGLQFVFWFTFAGFGVWWFIDLFRTYSLVKDFNKDVAVEVIRNLKAISN